MSAKESYERRDGTDQRLVNVLADLVRNFRHYPGDRWPHAQVAIQIESQFPAFAHALIRYQDQIDALALPEKALAGISISPAEFKKQNQCRQKKLQQLEKFALEHHGSVEAFLLWFQTGK